MDGVSDAAFRYITDKYGHPDILFTEFTSVEGIARAGAKLLPAFIYHKSKTPTVAQIFGTDLNSYYKATFVVAEMGFDGIDINMGCPDKNVAKRGGGAALILNPTHAKDIVTTVKRAVDDWNNGKNIASLDLPEDIIPFINTFRARQSIDVHKKVLPVSVKTRIGYDTPVVNEWIRHLLEVTPANISIHGRTLKQMYTGKADWEEIAMAVELAKGTNISIMGNGDVVSKQDALEKVKRYHVDGVLIGRATYGNPWVFTGEIVPFETKVRVMLEHAEAFVNLTPDQKFITLRKHLAWYCKGIDHATDIRMKLVRVDSVDEVRKIVSNLC